MECFPITLKYFKSIPLHFKAFNSQLSNIHMVQDIRLKGQKVKFYLSKFCFNTFMGSLRRIISKLKEEHYIHIQLGILYNDIETYNHSSKVFIKYDRKPQT